MDCPTQTEEMAREHSVELAEEYGLDPHTTALRCAWCHAAVYDDEELVAVMGDGVYHELCRRQQTDEEQLRVFLDQVARDCAEKIREYTSLHPHRVREHHARGLLGRIESLITAAVR